MTGESVFIVEDDGIIALFIYEILERAGYVIEDPVTADKNAIDRFLRKPLPDIALLDTGVPGRPGNFSELRRICEQENVPVVILTTFSDNAGEGQFPGMGREILITLPFSEKDLLASVKNALHAAR